MPRWFGKRLNLDKIPVEGNGQITVRTHNSKKTIYKNSFSTLFQEWLSYDEAAGPAHSFENVFLVPMPKDTVDITIELRNNRRETITSYTHTVVPTDILIKKQANVTLRLMLHYNKHKIHQGAYTSPLWQKVTL